MSAIVPKSCSLRHLLALYVTSHCWAEPGLRSDQDTQTYSGTHLCYYHSSYSYCDSSRHRCSAACSSSTDFSYAVAHQLTTSWSEFLSVSRNNPTEEHCWTTCPLSGLALRMLAAVFPIAVTISTIFAVAKGYDCFNWIRHRCIEVSEWLTTHALTSTSLSCSIQWCTHIW